MTNDEMFKLQDTRYRVNGRELRRKRLELDVTLAQVAHLCRWSASYQWRLENSDQITVCDETRRLVTAALQVLAEEQRAEGKI